MTRYYVYLTDENGLKLTDEQGQYIYSDYYNKNPSSWHLKQPKRQTTWAANEKTAILWHNNNQKQSTEWRDL